MWNIIKKICSILSTDPYRNYRFEVEIDGISQTAFQEIHFPEVSREVIVYRAGDGPEIISKQAGLLKSSNLILKSGITDSLELYSWFKKIQDGKITESKKNMRIVLIDYQGNEVASWVFTVCWPAKYIGPHLNSTDSEIAVETLEIVFETMRRIL